MKLVTRLLFALATLVVTATATFARSEAANQLVYGETTRLDAFDPYTAHEASAQRLADLVFDGLVTTKPSGQYEPALAASWAVKDGGTAVTFKLRKGVYWHDAKDLTVKAEDVVATVRLLLAAPSDIPNKERFQVVKAAERLDDETVVIHLTRALDDPLRALGFKILPAHHVGATPGLRRAADFTKKPVGTGPYKFVGSNAQGELLLTANERYFAGKPAIEKIVMKSYADQSIMAQSLMYNSLDLVTYVSPRDLGEIAGDAKLSLVPYDALSFAFFAFNTQRGALKDKRVRQAIAHALNRSEMLTAFFQSKGQLVSGPFPPSSWAYNLDVKPLGFDLKRSKALLDAAGLKDANKDGILETPPGKPVSLVFAVPLTGESETVKRIVLAFQGYLEAVGIKVELQFVDWLVWKQKVLGEHDYDVTIASWSFDDASNITSLFHSSSAKAWGNNFVLYRNAEVDALLTEAEATNDFDKRRAIYHKLHAVLADEAPYAYLWTLMHHAAHNNRLSGVRVEPFGFFRHVSAWRLQDGPAKTN